MQQFQHILVIIHPSEMPNSGAKLPAVRDATRLARAFGGRLMLMTAIDEQSADAVNASNELLQATSAAISVEGVNAEWRTEIGELVPCSIQCVREFMPDLVVVSRTPSTSSSDDQCEASATIDRTTDAIARRAECPVWIAANETTADEDSDHVMSALVPIDLNDAGFEAIDLIVTGGQSLDMRVCLLHAVEVELAGTAAASEHTQQELVATAEAELHEQLAMTDFRTLRFGVHAIVEAGSVERIVAEAIEREQPDLLVLGCSHANNTWKDKTDRLLHRSNCSVLLLKTEDDGIAVTGDLTEATIEDATIEDAAAESLTPSPVTNPAGANPANPANPAGTTEPVDSMPIYLDHHATTPVDPDVLDAMLPFFSMSFGNAGSINHRFGTDAARAVDVARDQVARMLSCQTEEVIFTSGATESNNLALKGVMAAAGSRRHLIVNAAEHRAVLDPAKRLKRDGFDVTVFPIRDFNAGAVEVRDVVDALRDDTALVSVMLANNEVGAINAVQSIAAVCRQRGALLHVDATQAVCWMDVNVSELDVDLLSISAHKIYGPKGIGALYVRRGETRVPIKALIDGGGQERQLRSGTLPVPLIVGLGKACELAAQRRNVDTENVAQLRDELWWQLAKYVPGIQLNGPPLDARGPHGHRLRLPNNLNVSIANVDGEALMAGLKRIAVSSGSACTSANPQPSHVLKAMGLSDQLIKASLRFGLGRNTTIDHIEVAVAEVTELVSRLTSR